MRTRNSQIVHVPISSSMQEIRILPRVKCSGCKSRISRIVFTRERPVCREQTNSNDAMFSQMHGFLPDPIRQKSAGCMSLLCFEGMFSLFGMLFPQFFTRMVLWRVRCMFAMIFGRRTRVRAHTLCVSYAIFAKTINFSNQVGTFLP